LSAPVRVVRDRWGVPHIYAGNQRDLFFAQGFVQAQDRLFQMDLWRRAAQGRLSEVLGANFIERDAMTRRMQYHGDLAADWASYGPETHAIADAFVRGINAWVDLVASRPPEEFALAGWRPEPWKADDLLNRTDAFLASANASDEVLRARLVAAVGAGQADALTRAAFASPINVPRELDINTISYVIGDALREVGTPPFFSGLSAPVKTVRLAARGESLAAFDGRCILGGCVAPPSNIPDILGRPPSFAGTFPQPRTSARPRRSLAEAGRALPPRRLARLGATPDFHHELLGSGE
jgi:penicillin G amidase